jgi:hypothetical protein
MGILFRVKRRNSLQNMLETYLSEFFDFPSKKLSAKMGYVTNERWNNMASF